MQALGKEWTMSEATHFDDESCVTGKIGQKGSVDQLHHHGQCFDNVGIAALQRNTAVWPV